MLSYIEKLQKKPESMRRIVLFVSVFMIMFVIVLIWLSTLSFRFSPAEKINTGKTNIDSGELSPFSVIKDNATGFYNNFKGNIGNIKKQFR